MSSKVPREQVTVTGKVTPPQKVTAPLSPGLGSVLQHKSCEQSATSIPNHRTPRERARRPQVPTVTALGRGLRLGTEGVHSLLCSLAFCGDFSVLIKQSRS